jgi:hypothetical protein
MDKTSATHNAKYSKISCFQQLGLGLRTYYGGLFIEKRGAVMLRALFIC